MIWCALIGTVIVFYFLGPTGALTVAQGLLLFLTCNNSLSIWLASRGPSRGHKSLHRKVSRDIKWNQNMWLNISCLVIILLCSTVFDLLPLCPLGFVLLYTPLAPSPLWAPLARARSSALMRLPATSRSVRWLFARTAPHDDGLAPQRLSALFRFRVRCELQTAIMRGNGLIAAEVGL